MCCQVGLQDLYNFKQENPHADLEPFLAKSSDYFRQYIERGLRTIEMEVKQGEICSFPFFRAHKKGAVMRISAFFFGAGSNKNSKGKYFLLKINLLCEFQS